MMDVNEHYRDKQVVHLIKKINGRNAAHVFYLTFKHYCGSTFIRRHQFSWFLQNALFGGILNSLF